MALSRAMKESMGFRKTIQKGPDSKLGNSLPVKGKSIKTYKDEVKKDGAKPNYIQDNNSGDRDAGKVKLVI